MASVRQTVIIILVFLITIVVCLLLFLRKASAPEHEQLSQLLHRTVKYGKDLLILETLTQKHKNEDPYGQIVEKKLMPLHQRLQSIKKQTKIYEDMERIPGGPQNFMTTTLNSLGEIEKKWHLYEDEFHGLQMNTSRELTSFDKEIDKAYKIGQNLFTEHDHDLLDQRLVHFDVTRFSDKDPEFPTENPKPFGEVLKLMTSLAELSTKYSQAQSELAARLLENNMRGPEEISGKDVILLAKLQKVNRLDGELDAFISAQNIHLSTFYTYVKKYLEQAHQNLNKIYQLIKPRRDRYTELSDMVEADVKNLRERIKNLKYAKANEEL